ncbi:MAG: helix-turn-helix transcriptional regulator [Actinomycetota bacterium]|nr:helix-turn-helix transcriptional regulator [Actinomycetota bacterium]
MEIRKRQAEQRLTDFALAKAAEVSTATVYRAKKGLVSRWSPMGRIAKALELEVEDVDEFRAALRERVFREARRRGAPEEVTDEAASLQEVFEVAVMDPGLVEHGAYTLIRQAMSYLDRSGRSDLVDKAIAQRKRRRRW